MVKDQPFICMDLCGFHLEMVDSHCPRSPPVMPSLPASGAKTDLDLSYHRDLWEDLSYHRGLFLNAQGGSIIAFPNSFPLKTLRNVVCEELWAHSSSFLPSLGQ